MTIPSTTADTQAAPIIEAVLVRLRERVPGLKEANCFPTDQPVPPEAYFPQGDVACTVCLIDGQFDERLWDGGGPNQLAETCSLGVTLLIRSNIDQPPRLTTALHGPTKGLVRIWKPQLLRALLVEDPAADILAPWQPLDVDDLPILRGMGLVPRSCQGPRTMDGLDWLGFTLWFSVQFDWDLREPEVNE
jgi:hypothetical protein